jgi:hypothetical protein
MVVRICWFSPATSQSVAEPLDVGLVLPHAHRRKRRPRARRRDEDETTRSPTGRSAMGDPLFYRFFDDGRNARSAPAFR